MATAARTIPAPNTGPAPGRKSAEKPPVVDEQSLASTQDAPKAPPDNVTGSTAPVASLAEAAWAEAKAPAADDEEAKGIDEEAVAELKKEEPSAAPPEQIAEVKTEMAGMEEAFADVQVASAEGAEDFVTSSGRASRAVGEGDVTNFLFGEGSGLLLPLLGIAAAAIAVAVIASDDDDNDDIIDDPVNQAPVLTASDAVEFEENLDIGDVVLNADAVDPDDDDVVFSLEGDDADLFAIDADDGEVRFVQSPDFEDRESYNITVVATDTEGNSADQDVTVTVVDVEEQPVFVNQQVEFEVPENILPGAVLYDPNVVDPEGQPVTLSLTGEDADFFEVDAVTQAVFFVDSPDFEDQETLNFSVVATDPDGNQATQDVIVNIEDLDETPPDDDFATDFGFLAFRVTGQAEYLDDDAFFFSPFTALNDSGVSGVTLAGFDEETGTLTVTILAEGLEAGQVHAQHVHGFMADSEGDVAEAMVPTSADDADGDGFIEVAEGADAYGPILLPLMEDGSFPTADQDGTISFSESYELPVADLGDMPMLDLREIVLHGKTLEAGEGANGGEADGTAGYKASLPVAAGALEQVQPDDAFGVLALLDAFSPPGAIA